MKSTLIKDTTKSERIELVKQWEESEGCESSGIDLMEFFRDYIDGDKENWREEYIINSYWRNNSLFVL